MMDIVFVCRIRHRHQRQRKKGRRRERYPTATDSYRLKQPQFNDLWVRLEATRYDLPVKAHFSLYQAIFKLS